MATNTAALKTFAQETRKKLISLITTKMQFVLGADTAELRGYEREISELRKQIQAKTEKIVIEEVAYTWFNRVMALRFMDANGYNAPMIVTPAAGQTRPEILQDAMGGSIDEGLMLTPEEKLLPEVRLYRKLLVAVCNRQMSQPMPFLFEHIADYTELLLPDDLLSDQSFVSDIRRGMTDEDCQNVELMGWLYQFYITDRKVDAESKKSKKGGLKSDEQAAATQLFTPHWIVRYMVENSLGRIWMTLHPESRLVDSMPYYIPTPEGQTDTIPDDIHSAKDIRFIDPCMGSGHILVYAFDLFCKMYEEEGQMTRDIPTLILQYNLYGIDIDCRCYQLAAFALTMKARAYERRYLRHTVMPNVIDLEPIDRSTIESTGAWPAKSLMWQFEHIDTIGSLLKVTPEECAAIRVENGLFRVRQQLMKTQAEYLSRQYHCVVTNPPYLGKGMGDDLKKYIVDTYPNTKGDCMATFMERSRDFCMSNGKYAMINMQSWMFLSSYIGLRNSILSSVSIDSLIHLGAHAFDELSGEVVQNAAFVITNARYNDYQSVVNGLPKSGNDTTKAWYYTGTYFRLVDGRNCSDKERMFLDAQANHTEKVYYADVEQRNFEKIPGCPIAYWVSKNIRETFTRNLSLSAVANPCVGLQTADNDRFLRSWFEVSFSRIAFGCENAALAARTQKKWFPCNKGGGQRKWYGNQNDIINWENDGFEIKNFKGAVIRNEHCYFKPTIAWNMISSGFLTFRYFPKGFILNNASNGIPCEDLYGMLGYLSSKYVALIADIINPTVNLSNGVVGTFPYMVIDNEDYRKIVAQNVNLAKLDWDSHETSWDFEANPLVALRNKKVAEGCLDSSFQLKSFVKDFEAQWEQNFNQLHENEEELNRQFIEIYGLQDELSPEVPKNEITILQQGEISIEDKLVVWHNDVVIKQFISWLVGCFMGRYSADKPGLIIASQGQKVANLNLKKQTIEIDDDGIIPVILEEDFFADDMTQRIETAVKTLLGEKHFHDNMKFIRTAIGQPLRDYLYKDFYNDHLQMYSVKGAKRPIYWLFSSKMGDKRKKGYFKALVYMHRLEADTLSKLHADYVHPYLTKVEQQLVEAEDNAMRDDLTGKQKKAALDLAETLRDKVREVKAFETQLVEMASARLRLDLDDGVKANYPKFYPLVEPIKGLESSNDD